MAKDQRTGGWKGDHARTERLRTALRDNLKRRKMQARARAETAGSKPHDSAGIVPDKSKE